MNTLDSHHAGDNIHILLVEDDPMSQLLATRILNKLGHVSICDNLKRAVGDYLRLRPDLVLLDIDLGHGKLGGFEVLSILRMHDDEANVVILSGRATPEIVARAIDEGANGFIQKPFQSGQLLRYAQDCRRRKEERHGC